MGARTKESERENAVHSRWQMMAKRNREHVLSESAVARFANMIFQLSDEEFNSVSEQKATKIKREATVFGQNGAKNEFPGNAFNKGKSR